MMCICFFSSAGVAQFRSSNEAGLGFTDNANLENTQRDSDVFLKLSTANSYKTGEHQLGLRMAYMSYLNQKINDLFSWKISERFHKETSAWSLFGTLLGNDYVSGDPGTTESSFDNIGFEFIAERLKDLSARTSMKFGPGAYSRFYTWRSDHTLLGFFEIEFTANSDFIVSGRSELGFTNSSDGHFRKSYFEIGGDADYRFKDDLSLYGDLTLRQTNFPGRSLSDQTTVTTRRGRTARIGAENDYESQGYSQLFVELLKNLNSDLDGAVSIRLINQNSKSGYEDYSVTEFYSRINYSF
jgi:hypothetical protein